MAFTIDALQFVWFPLVVGAATWSGSFVGKKLLFKKKIPSEAESPTQSA
jgi:hypothetical protein